MSPRTFRKPAELLAASAALPFVLLLGSCSSNQSPIICNLPSAGSGTCVCEVNGAGACPAQLNEYLYTSGGSGQVLTFDIAPLTGALSGPTSTLSGPASTGIALASSQFVYVSDPSHGQLDGFSIGQDGTLNTLAGSPFSVGQSISPQRLASATNGSMLLYATDDGGVDAFSISSTGIPMVVSGSPFPSGTNSYLTTEPNGQYVYTSIDDPPGGIFGFTIGSTGALSEIAGSPFRIPGQTVANSQPAGIVDNELYVYAALTGSNQIAAFSVTQSTGALTPIANSPFSAGNGPTALALTNSFLYAINSADSTISGYSINSSTGALTPLANSPFAIAGTALSADFRGQYLYVSGATGIQAYSVASSTGDLTAIAGSPFSASGVLSLVVVAQ